MRMKFGRICDGWPHNFIDMHVNDLIYIFVKWIFLNSAVLGLFDTKSSRKENDLALYSVPSLRLPDNSSRD